MCEETMGIVVHGSREEGVYYIYYGKKAFKYCKTSDRRNHGQLLVDTGKEVYLRVQYLPQACHLEYVIDIIKEKYPLIVNLPLTRRYL
jgi:hypothetical protein